MADLDWVDAAARMFEPPRRRWETPGDVAAHLNPKTVRTPSLDLIDDELVRAANTPGSRLIVCMAPQEGKSVRVAGDFPTWLLTQNADLRIVTASYAQSLADRNGCAIRRRITDNADDLGLRIAPDNGSVAEWTSTTTRAASCLSAPVSPVAPRTCSSSMAPLRTAPRPTRPCTATTCGTGGPTPRPRASHPARRSS
ncbi:hypothetical protein [Allobranchiibius huperziae]|uniref:Uncharacterized protein n=1 Tax=Allobranchiibius huperziae TaxID=1874116 RepID=A0A853DF19_9MICO|nr:hypothetical protein [Allobranchiibius huperziae]NYJ76082.1 hypothetical protein [Allobranchiibius huperziae]